MVILTGCAIPVQLRVGMRHDRIERSITVSLNRRGGRTVARPVRSVVMAQGSCRYGDRTSQNRLKSLTRSGCGPCSEDSSKSDEMKSPTGLFGSPV